MFTCIAKKKDRMYFILIPQPTLHPSITPEPPPPPKKKQSIMLQHPLIQADPSGLITLTSQRLSNKNKHMKGKETNTTKQKVKGRRRPAPLHVEGKEGYRQDAEKVKEKEGKDTARRLLYTRKGLQEEKAAGMRATHQQFFR